MKVRGLPTRDSNTFLGVGKWIWASWQVKQMDETTVWNILWGSYRGDGSQPAWQNPGDTLGSESASTEEARMRSEDLNWGINWRFVKQNSCISLHHQNPPQILCPEYQLLAFANKQKKKKKKERKTRQTKTRGLLAKKYWMPWRKLRLLVWISASQRNDLFIGHLEG